MKEEGRKDKVALASFKVEACLRISSSSTSFLPGMEARVFYVTLRPREEGGREEKIRRRGEVGLLSSRDVEYRTTRLG